MSDDNPRCKVSFWHDPDWDSRGVVLRSKYDREAVSR